MKKVGPASSLSPTIAFAIYPHLQPNSKVGLGWIRLDLPKLARTQPDSPGLRNTPGSAPSARHPVRHSFSDGGSFLARHSFNGGGSEGGAPGAAADALVRRPERVSASSPSPPKAQSPKPKASAFPPLAAISKNPDGMNPSAAPQSTFRARRAVVQRRRVSRSQFLYYTLRPACQAPPCC
jgi:hypothetical protein